MSWPVNVSGPHLGVTAAGEDGDALPFVHAPLDELTLLAHHGLGLLPSVCGRHVVEECLPRVGRECGGWGDDLLPWGER